MYYRENDQPIETYKNATDKTPDEKSTNKFPIWLLILLICLLFLVGLWLILKLTRHKSTMQQFGFRF